ncbi:MAG: thiamine pyrophosphate-dependent enzyme [bacterium]|nr:thiamine pyrophosphate-dependent enzyme [bacterium]
MEEILLQKPGKKIILLGNEAIVRGALESGVQFVSTYPGTPASEIGDTFSRIQNSEFKIQNLYFEYSTNEKVALEAAIGASFSEVKTLVAMKNFGLNIALDSLLPFLYTGAKGPTVIVGADDPSCHSSAQSEENSRAFAFLAHIPILEPSDPQECKDFTKLAFKISEKFKIPVIVRTTTRVAHQRSPVSLSVFDTDKLSRGKFVKEPERFVTMPPRVLEMKKELLEKIEKIKQFSEKSKLNASLSVSDTDRQKIGVITSGVSYLYVREALRELNLNLPVLKLGFFYPLPEEKIKDFIKKLKKVLIVEELEPYLEKEVRALAKDVNPKLQILGKSHLSQVGELRPEDVILALAKITGRRYEIVKSLPFKKNKHLPRFCIGKGGSCPYWKLFAAVKKAAPKNTIFGGDIGCYMMAALPPHNLYDYLSCMGSSIGIAHGIKKNTQQKVIAFIGDSTFFHAGIPALINTVFNKSNPLIIILDNRTTAMTGHQPHPGIGKTGMGEETSEIKIEDILAALKIKHWKVIDPETNFEEMVKTIGEFLTKKEVSVIVARKICWLLAQRQKNEKKS